MTRTGPAGVDLTRGVAITSRSTPDDDTHVENVRYGKGSNAMGAARDHAGRRRRRHTRGRCGSLGDGGRATRSSSPGRCRSTRWSERTVIGLVMQTRDNSLHGRGAGAGCSAVGG